MAVIVPLRDSHIPALIQLSKDLHQQTNFSELDFSPAICAKNLVAIMEDDRTACFVAKLGVEIIGYVVGHVYPTSFGRDYIAINQALYVRPEKRSFRVAIDLIRAYVQWSKAIGAARITFGVNTGVSTEGITKLLTLEGFKQNGIELVYED